MIKYMFTFFCVGFSFFGYGQDDLLDKLDKEFPIETTYEIATFKTTRIGLGHSVETRKKGAFEISLFNRFWNLEDKPENRFIVDEVSMRFGLNYAFTDNLTIGGGYTNFDKITDGFLKYKVLKQQKNTSKAPLSVVLFQGVSYRNNVGLEDNSGYLSNVINFEVYSFTSQLLIARKFNQQLSMQISPTFIHRDRPILIDQSKNLFALGFGARYKIGGHMSLVSEYYYNMNPVNSVPTRNPYMIGVNWELSHLLLQFQMTNTRSVIEDAFITQTQNPFNFADGNFHFGFNAIFVLHSKKNKL